MKRGITLSRRFLSVALCCSMALSLLAGLQVEKSTSKAAESANKYNLSNPVYDEKTDTTQWDCIYFGNYWQNDTDGDGTADKYDKKEPIKWRVLNVNGNDAFLISDEILDNQTYIYNWKYVTWENSDIRNWLNSTFMGNAFTKEEQKAIRQTNVVNEKISSDELDAGNNTTDYLYLLSAQELTNPLYGFCSNGKLNSNTRVAYETSYRKFLQHKGVTGDTDSEHSGEDSTGGESGGSWWTRSPGKGNRYYKLNAYNGEIITFGQNEVSHLYSGVRPALHIDLSSSCWSYAGEVNSEDVGDTAAARKYDFDTNYTSDDADGTSHTGQIRVKFNEGELKHSSKEYNHSIAKFCSVLSTLAYDTKNGLKELMDTMNYHYGDSYVDKSGESICYNLADKTIILDKKKTDIVLVVMRGTYNMEWIDNFNPGLGETHKGFQKGADVVYEALEKYIEKEHIGENGRQVKIIVTGHSRGAAVANLLGKKILDEEAILSDAEDLFDYSFATPNSTSSVKRSDSKYDGIFSIVNPEDFVTKVMLSKKWSYGRYGQTLVLPSSSTENVTSYKSYLSDLQTCFGNYRPYGNIYEPYPNGMTTVSNYINFVSWVVPSVKQYYEKSLSTNPFDLIEKKYTLQKLYEKMLGYYMSGNIAKKKYSEGEMVRAFTGVYGKVGQLTLAFFAVNQKINPHFEMAHLSETYLAAMNSLEATDLYVDGKPVKRKIMHGIVNCPVDVSIEDSAGKIVAKIEDNEIIKNVDEDAVHLAVTGDSKQFWLPGNEDYAISLTGNGKGNMDYILAEEDADSGEYQRILYKTVPIQNNMVYTSKIYANKDVTGRELQDGSGTIINASDKLTVNELENLSVKVEVEGVGTANSFDGLSYGDCVVLSAHADENNSFLGWYDSDGNLISKEKEHPIVVTENKNYTAKFTNVIVYPESISMESELTMIPGDEKYLEASVLPSNATYLGVEYESSNEDIVSVTEEGIIKAKNVGTAVVIAKTLMDRNIQRKCEVVVKSSDSSNITKKPSATHTPSPATKFSQTTKKAKVKKPGRVIGVSVYNKKKKKMVVSWSWKTNVAGYQIQYALNKKFTKKKKSKWAGKWKSAKTISKLKKGKKYYVRVRAYRKKSGKKLYGKWSKVKKVKIKK